MIKRRRENRGLLRSGKSRSKDGKEWKCSAIGTILPQQTMGFEPAMQVWINPRYYINNSLTVRWSGWRQSEWEGRWQQPERERRRWQRRVSRSNSEGWLNRSNGGGGNRCSYPP
uniref:Uncharacterized protein n=2 Tax=Picea TaxID=3328 RepID=A0A124GNM4_PICGL|nr:hypothetical protein ABT39_MTgene3842 [Picea glauca]QHR90176.1 hypothetical protein Q903MT_gene4199 [Picea sitchensis]